MSENKLFSRRKHKALPIILAIILVFAIIGLVNVILWISSLTGSLVRKDSQKRMFEREIYPVMMFDPMTFEDPTELDDVTLLQMSLWSALLGEGNAKYSYDESMRRIVPASDVDVEARKLFGSTVSLKHQGFYDNDIFYEYNEKTNSYAVPNAWQQLQYTPSVQSISKQDGLFYLYVDYIPPATLWNTDSYGNITTVPADKTLVYVLKNDNGEYIITALIDPLELEGLSEESEESYEE